MDKLIEETIADVVGSAEIHGGRFQFAFIPPERHRKTAFLIHLEAASNEMRRIAPAALNGVQADRTDLHFILHPGFGGSTLLGRLLGQPGVAITPQEPPVVTDIVRDGFAKPRRDAAQLLHEATQLLGRPITSGEANICKMTHLGNGVASSMRRSTRRPRFYACRARSKRCCRRLLRAASEGSFLRAKSSSICTTRA